MKRLFLALALALSFNAFGQAPILRNSFSTNSVGKTPNLLPANTNPLFPISVTNPDGTGADRTINYSPGFSLTQTNMALSGILRAYGGAFTNSLTLNGAAVSTNTSGTTVSVNGTNVTTPNWTNTATVTYGISGSNVLATSAGGVALTSFNSSQFATNGGVVSLLSGAVQTNISSSGTATLSSLTLSNALRTPFLDIGVGTNFNANLSSFQGVTLTASKEYNYTNGSDGTRLILRIQQDGSGGWVPNLSHVTWLTDTNNWNTNASAINYVAILQAGATAEASLIGTNSSSSGGSDNVWTNTGTIITQDHFPVEYQYYVYATNTTTAALRVGISAVEPLTNYIGYVSISANNNVPGTISTAGATYYGGSGNFGISGNVGSSSSGLTNGAIGISSYAGGKEGLSIGVLAESDPSVNSQTNIALVANVVDEGKNGPMIAGYFELGSDASVDPDLSTSSVLLLDNRSRPDLPLIIGRTNNGTAVFRLSGAGLVSATGADLTNSFKFQSGAGAGKVLISDANGAASWTGAVSVNATNTTTPNFQDSATVTWAKSGSNLTATAAGGSIGGSGTSNNLARFTGSATLGNSGISDVNGAIISVPNSYAQVRVPDGAAANPGLAFTVETNIGLARIASAALSLVTGAAERVRVGATETYFFGNIRGAGLTASGLVGTDANTNLVIVPPRAPFWMNNTALTYSGGTNLTIDGSGGTNFFVTLTNTAFFVTPSNVPASKATNTSFTVWFMQDSTGGRLVTWTNASFKWPGNSQFQPLTNANAVSCVNFSMSPFTNGIFCGDYGILDSR